MLITEASKLEPLLKRAYELGCVAIDTEFVWERTYYPNLGLVQIGFNRKEAHLLDVLEIKDVTILKEMLEAPEIKVIFHDALQDLQVLNRYCGAIPQNVFDTRLATGFTGKAGTLSLGNLISEYLGIALAKTESRSDWLQRPLTNAQMLYAQEDVFYLCEITKLIESECSAENLSCLREELEYFSNPAHYVDMLPENAYLRIKGHGMLDPESLGALKAITAYREERAQSRNVPRGFILKDDICKKIAAEKSCKILNDRSLRIPQGVVSDLEEILKKGLQEPFETSREATIISPKKQAALFKSRLNSMVTHLERECEAKQIDPSIVTNRTELKGLIQFQQDDSENYKCLRGWRRDLVGKELLSLASS